MIQLNMQEKVSAITAALVVLVVGHLSAAQTVRIDANDVETLERMELFDASMAAAESMRKDGDIGNAIEEYLLLYEDAGLIHLGAQVLVASRLSALYEQQGNTQQSMRWSERAVTLHASDPDQATGTGNIGRRHAAKLRDQGRYIEAAEAYEASVNVNESARFQHESWANAARMYLRAGEIERARLAVAMGEPLIPLMNVSDQHYLMARSLELGLSNTGLVDDPAYLFDLSLDIYNDPRLADTPERLEVVGWKGIDYGTMSGRVEEAEWLARDILVQAARFERELRSDDPRRNGISNAYINSARNLYSILKRKGEFLEAIEVLETAFRTYPDSVYRNTLLSLLHMEYDAAGLDATGLPALAVEDAQAIVIRPDGTQYRPGVNIIDASALKQGATDPVRPLSIEAERIAGGLALVKSQVNTAETDTQLQSPRWVWPTIIISGLALVGFSRLKK